MDQNFTIFDSSSVLRMLVLL